MIMNFFFVIENSKAIEREVQLGALQGGYVIVEKGLVDGDRLMIEGLSHLNFKDKVSFK